MMPSEYLANLKRICQETGDAEVAAKQSKYMRNQFAYYGIKAPAMAALQKAFFKEYGLPNDEELKELIVLCMNDQFREIHYFAVEVTHKVLKKQGPTFIETLEYLVLHQSWWDTVDWLAKLVGIHFKKYPELILPVTEKWMASEEMWLQRVCILFQLAYKENTDESLLYRYILEVADSKEFFLQKAAGWALRQYGKTNPDSVVQFVDSQDLAPLTVREGLRLIKAKK